MKNIKDFYGLSNVYLNKVFLNENENSSENDEFKTLLLKIKESSDKLTPKIEKLRNLLLQDILNKSFEENLNSSPEKFKNFTLKDSIATESYLNEGKFSQLKSNLSGWKRFAYGEKTSTGESNIQSHRVNKRFEIFKDKLEKHLRELERDLETTSNADNTVKNEIKQMISRLGSEEFNIKPKQSKLGDIRHKLGRGIEWGSKAVILGGIGAAIGTAVSSIAGIVGVPALMIKAATAAAIRKTAVELINGQKPKVKEVALQSAIAAVAAHVLGVSVNYIYDHMDDIQDALGLTASDNLPETDVSDTGAEITGIEGTLNTDEYFEKYHDTPFDSSSTLDKAKVSFDNALFDQNITGLEEWSDGPSPAVVNAASEANLNPEQYQKLASEIKKLSDDELRNFKTRLVSDPDKYAKAFIRVLLKR
jgi:hypothetical protein